MSNYRFDGSVESTNTPTPQNTFHRKDTAIYRCLITNVIYANDPKNITKNSQNSQVLYEAIILGGFKEGQIISNIRPMSLLGGKYNFEEKIYRKTSKDLLKDRLNTHDGDVVYVLFNQGDPSAPCIIGCDKSFLNKSSTGSNIETGPQLVQQYNGVLTNINKDGEFTLTRKGGTYDTVKDYFVPIDGVEENSQPDENAEPFQAKLQFSNNKMLWEDPQSGILFEKTEKRYTLKVGKTDEETPKDIYTEVIDSVNKKTTKTWDQGITIVEDSQNDTITFTTKAGGKIKIQADKIAMGASSAELLQQISDALQKHIDWANNTGAVHTHLGNLGYPTSAPVETAQYIQLATDLTTIKSLIDGIKGTL